MFSKKSNKHCHVNSYHLLVVAFVVLFSFFAGIICDDKNKANRGLAVGDSSGDRWQIVEKGEKAPPRDEEFTDLKAAIKKAKSKKVHRSYEKLKQEFDNLGIVAKTDAELLHELVDKFVVSTERAQITVLLEDLEYLSHQYDNAIEFVRQNGFEKVIYRSLNSSDAAVKGEALRLFGSLVQNNARVQIHALETGGINTLLKMLALDPDISVKNRAVYSLSCLLRRFPLAQKTFLANGGSQVVSELFQLDNIKIKLKVVTLINDLMEEHREALADTEAVNYADRRAQYEMINLKDKLAEDAWCMKIRDLMITIFQSDRNDHDGIEKCLTAVNFFLRECHKIFHSSKDIFASLKNNYQFLMHSKEGGTDDYFEHLYRLCKQILDSFNKFKNNDEL